MKKSIRYNTDTIIGNIYFIARLFYLRSYNVLAIIVSIILIFLLNTNNSIARASNKYALNTITNIYYVINVPIEIFYYFTDSLEKYLQMIHENESLKEENHKLQFQIREMKTEISHNLTFKRLLNVVDSINNHFITAKIISKNFDNFNMNFIINAGTTNGISVNDIVLYGANLVGRVIEVSNNSARVLTISDAKSKIPIIFSQSKEEAIAVGNPVNPEVLNIKYLYNYAQITNSEQVLTSGIGGIYPLGILIGKVIKTEENILIYTPIEWNKMDYVIVITKDLK